MIGALPVTLSLVNELDSVSSNGTPAWDSARYLREILKAPVYEAAEHTPLQEMPALSARLGNTVEVKREDLQTVHSFKIRGAWHRLTALDAEARARGVVAFSSGNHAQGVAFAGQKLGIPSVIVMPATTPVMPGTRRPTAPPVTMYAAHIAPASSASPSSAPS